MVLYRKYSNGLTNILLFRNTIIQTLLIIYNQTKEYFKIK